MKSLIALQRSFRQGLHEGLKASDLKALGIPGLAHRFEVYRYAFKARVVDAVAEDFPLTEKFLGKRKFREELLKFVSIRPSMFKSLTEVSQELGPYFKSLKNFGNTVVPDLVKYEWAKLKVDYEPENRVEAMTLDKLTPELIKKAKIVLSAGVEFVNSSWTVHKKTKIKKGSRLVIYDSRGETLVEELDLTEWQIFELLRQEIPLAKVFRSKEILKMKPEALQSFFAQWSKKGIIVGFKI